ncbi:MAG: GGDEF domain-containing protein [Clostridia bacterium]|nr:GGDEF domain-containing protein [Clostridia bacterium]
MYTKEQLSRYAYFERELQQRSLEAMLDPLTGLVSRAYILNFARALIEAGTPFTFGMLDLDNFKFINDTYGHHVGDAVLMDVAKDLSEYLNGYGVAGRFGGDELLFINLRDLAYDDKKAFLNDLYLSPMVVRKNVRLKDCAPFITGTVGCATFPDDAQDYDALFSTIDKTLYRGKVKGRNCYIIYVEEKHRDIQIRQITRHGVYTSLHSLVRHFEMVPGLKNKLHSVTPLLMEELQISDLYYVGKRGIMRSVRNNALAKDASDIDNLMTDDLYSSNTLKEVAEKSPVFNAALQSMEVEALMVVRVSMDDEDAEGYLICAEPRSRRIWQEDECAIMYFLAKLIASRICIGGEAMDE